MSFALAQIKVGKSEPTNVQFNPTTLRVTTTNQIDDDHPNQVSKPTGFKLDVELLYDSSEFGTDVTIETWLVTNAATASGQGATTAAGAGHDHGRRGTTLPPASLKVVTFSWGSVGYTGYLESVNETLDYFTSDGIPMRSTLQISLKGKADGFYFGGGTTFYSEGYDKHDPLQLPTVVMMPSAQDKTINLLQRGMPARGDNSVGRGIAALNGMESIRGAVGAFASASVSAGARASAGASASAGAGGGMMVGAGAQLQAAAGFAMSGGVSAGASAGFGMGASAGLSAGAGIGASVGVGMAAGAGISSGTGGGIGIGGGIGAGAGIGASAGIGLGGSGGGVGMSASTSVTGLDGVTRTNTTSTASSGGGFGSGSAGAMASAGAFAGLGTSRISLPPSSFNLDSLLPPAMPAAGSGASYDVSGRMVSSDGQVAASYAARSSVKVW